MKKPAEAGLMGETSRFHVLFKGVLGILVPQNRVSLLGDTQMGLDQNWNAAGQVGESNTDRSFGLGLSEVDDLAWLTDRSGQVVFTGTTAELQSNPVLVGRLTKRQRQELIP